MKHVFVLCALYAIAFGLPTSSVDTAAGNKDAASLQPAAPVVEAPVATSEAQANTKAAEQNVAVTIPETPAAAPQALPVTVAAVETAKSTGESAPAVAAPAPATHFADLETNSNSDSACSGKKCKKPNLSKACKGKTDLCRNETECCEIDKCNVWQHVGRDSAALLVFYVSWCPVSRDFMLNYDLLRAKFEPFDNLLVAKVDGEQNTNLVADFGIDEFPALLFFRRDCYWSPGGCYDQMVWQRYNGTSNEFDEVDAWISQQLLDEQNGSAFPQLPEEPERAGCKVSKLTRPPEDMREPFKFPQDDGAPLLPPQMLMQIEEGTTSTRASCKVKLVDHVA